MNFPTIRVKALATASLAAVALNANAQSGDPLNVVASFSVLGDLVHQVGGDTINLTVLVNAGADSHVYAPTPKDAATLSQADLLVVNGLDFESWLPRLVDSAGFSGTTLVATAGIEPLAFDEEHHDEHHDDGHDDEEHHDDDHDGEEHHDEHHDDDHDEHGHGAFDPHAWHNIELAQIYVLNIRDALSAADPLNAAHYADNADAYIAQLTALNARIRADIDAIAMDQRVVVTSHDAFGYLEHAYGIEFLAPQGLSTESEASAQDVANIIRQIKAEGIRGVFVESIGDPRLINQIARETDAKVGGTLYSDSLSPANGPAATYLDMMAHNARTILDSLQN